MDMSVRIRPCFSVAKLIDNHALRITFSAAIFTKITYFDSDFGGNGVCRGNSYKLFGNMCKSLSSYFYRDFVILHPQ